MPERYTPPVRLRLEMARYVLAEDYVRALEGRGSPAAAKSTRALSGYDALMLPTVPIPAPPIGAAQCTIGGVERAGPQRHAAAHAAVQHHRPSGHVAAVREDLGGLPVGLAIGRERACRPTRSFTSRAIRRGHAASAGGTRQHAAGSGMSGGPSGGADGMMSGGGTAQCQAAAGRWDSADGDVRRCGCSIMRS